MRPPQKNRNGRNKSGRKPMGNLSSRVYESAGPEGKVRGTPQQIIEKYQFLARDAQTSGDRVMAENFLQHAEHYVRLLGAAQAQMEERRPFQPGGGRADHDDGGDEAEREDEGSAREHANGAGREDEDSHREQDRRHEHVRRREPARDAPAAQPAASSAALETIDARDDADVGPVATPESGAAFDGDAAPEEPVRKPRRRRRAPVAEGAGGEPDQPAVAEAQPG